MAKVNGKAKGSAFEREVCKVISSILTDKQEDIACWRTAGSGGMATTRTKKKIKSAFTVIQSGDITQVLPQGVYPKLDSFFDKYAIECKSYNTIDFYPPIETGTLAKFLDITLKLEKDTKKIGLLIVKQNRKRILVVTKENKTNHIMNFKYNNINFYVYDGIKTFIN